MSATISASPYCDVYLIRHGETDWNIEGRWQGSTDIALNGKGETQAFELGKKFDHLNFSACISSDLIRAKKTAEIVIGTKPITIIETPALRERYMGVWEGRLIHELKDWLKENNIPTDNLSKEKYLSNTLQSAVESYADVYERLSDVIKNHAIPHLGSSILVSSHGGVLRSLLYELDFRPDLHWQVLNCAYIKLRVSQEGEISIDGYDGVKLTNNPPVAF